MKPERRFFFKEVSKTSQFVGPVPGFNGKSGLLFCTGPTLGKTKRCVLLGSDPVLITTNSYQVWDFRILYGNLSFRSRVVLFGDPQSLENFTEISEEEALKWLKSVYKFQGKEFPVTISWNGYGNVLEYWK